MAGSRYDSRLQRQEEMELQVPRLNSQAPEPGRRALRALPPQCPAEQDQGLSAWLQGRRLRRRTAHPGSRQSFLLHAYGSLWLGPFFKDMFKFAPVSDGWTFGDRQAPPESQQVTSIQAPVLPTLPSQKGCGRPGPAAWDVWPSSCRPDCAAAWGVAGRSAGHSGRGPCLVLRFSLWRPWSCLKGSLPGSLSSFLVKRSQWSKGHSLTFLYRIP